MRCIVLADVHCNLISLKLMLKEIKKIEYDKIIFLGDYITDGENNNKVLSLVRKYGDYIILGNREEYIINYSSDYLNKLCFGTTVTTYNELSKKNHNYLKKLDKYKILNIEGKRILLIHGKEYFISGTLDYDRLINEYEFDICLFAHCHISSFNCYRGKYFLNPGSVGEPSGKAFYECAILDITDSVNVRFLEIPTSKSFDKLKKHVYSYKFYNNNYIWYNLCLATIKMGYDYVADFMNEYNKLIADKVNENDVYISLYNKKYKGIIDDILV